ncbi:MAG: restriction endonuclease subunit S [Thermodesulfobacteriota bacterium]
MEMIQFDKICETTQGVQIPRSEQIEIPEDGYSRYLYIADFLSDGSCKYIKNNFPKKIVYETDLVMANTGSPGRVFLGKSGILSNNLFKISFDKEQADRDYLYRVLSSPQFQERLQSQMKQGIQRHLGHKTIARQTIPLPPLPVQQKIAAILDAADGLKQKDQALIAKYDELSQALFLDMFGDPVANSMGWEKKTVAEVLQRKSQNGLYLPKDKYKADGIEMIHMSDAFYGIVNVGNLKKVVLDDNELEKYRLSEDDLLLARRSLTYEGAAKPCRIPKYNKPLVYESSLIRITPNKSMVTTLYLYFFFSNEKAKSKYVNKYISCSTISGINNKGLNSIEILLPSITLQNQFAERIKAIEQQKQQAQASLQKSADLFNCLLQKAFKGELVT